MTDLLEREIKIGDYVACTYKDCNWIVYGVVSNIKKTEKAETVSVTILKDGSGHGKYWYRHANGTTVNFKWYDDPNMNRYKKIIIIPTEIKPV